MGNPSTSYEEKRTLVDKVLSLEKQNEALLCKLDDVYSFIYELYRDKYIESDYPREKLAEMIYGTKNEELPNDRGTIVKEALDGKGFPD